MIVIVESKLRFRAPTLGQRTRPIAEHYHGRRIVAEVDGQKRMFFFDKETLPFDATEDDMIKAVEAELKRDE